MPVKFHYVTMLLIDSGNSLIKWAFVQDGAWQHQGSIRSGDWPQFRQALATLPVPRRILVSNVAGDDAASQIGLACSPWGKPLEFIVAQETQCGVRNGYEQPARLGSDRWAALIAAWHKVHGPCLVVSSGTATTIDALSCEGLFLGGLILPGLDMMRRSLAAGTAHLAVPAGKLQAFPRSTSDAIVSGAIQATTGAIYRQHALLNDRTAPCVLSGGAATVLQDQLDMELIRVDDLVLHGLELIGMDTGT